MPLSRSRKTCSCRRAAELHIADHEEGVTVDEAMRHCRYHVASALHFAAAAVCFAYMAVSTWFSATDYQSFFWDAFWIGWSLLGMALIDVLANTRGVNSQAIRAAELCVLDQGVAPVSLWLAESDRARAVFLGEIEGYLDRVRKGKHDDQGIERWQKSLR